jgi:SpoVK/Ycf46/Vps4 family AAA+-type ATPase
MGTFRIKKITKFSELAGNSDKLELPQSDLCLSDNEAIYQFSYADDAEVMQKITVKPGIHTLASVDNQLKLLSTEFKSTDLLESVSNTKSVMKEIKGFFSKLHVYEQYGLEKRRSILFYSLPGGGKSSALQKACRDLMSEDPGTAVIVWPTSELRPEHVSRFFSFGSEYSTETTRLILIIEDIGGGGVEEWSGPKEVSSGMLNFLDGVGVAFRLPTFIVATTNFPQNLISSLADRPGRFDQLIELTPPSDKDRVALYEFFVKRPVTVDEKEALTSQNARDLSIAHVKEIPIRMAIHDRTIKQVVKEMHDHSTKVKKHFDNARSMGIGYGDD